MVNAGLMARFSIFLSLNRVFPLGFPSCTNRCSIVVEHARRPPQWVTKVFWSGLSCILRGQFTKVKDESPHNLLTGEIGSSKIEAWTHTQSR